jgi:hypothetical protein
MLVEPTSITKPMSLDFKKSKTIADLASPNQMLYGYIML